MLKVIICDDSKISLDINKVYIEEFSRKRGISVKIYTYSKIDNHVKELINTKKIDIAILDIDFDEPKEGIQLAEYITKKQSDIAIIFITNYVEYAMEAYAIMPFGFLKKPVEEEQFEKLFYRAIVQINGLVATKNNNSIDVIANGTNQLIKETSIFYIEKSGHVAEISTRTGVYGVYNSLKSIEEKLSNDFLKINKGILINMNYVIEITNRTVKMKNGRELPISQRKIKYVLKEIDKYLNGFY